MGAWPICKKGNAVLFKKSESQVYLEQTVNFQKDLQDRTNCFTLSIPL